MQLPHEPIYSCFTSLTCNCLTSLICNCFTTPICNCLTSLIYNCLTSPICNCLSSPIYICFTSLTCNCLTSLICNCLTSRICNCLMEGINSKTVEQYMDHLGHSLDIDRYIYAVPPAMRIVNTVGPVLENLGLFVVRRKHIMEQILLDAHSEHCLWTASCRKICRCIIRHKGRKISTILAGKNTRTLH